MRRITSLPVEMVGRVLDLLGLKALVDYLDRLASAQP